MPIAIEPMRTELLATQLMAAAGTETSDAHDAGSDRRRALAHARGRVRRGEAHAARRPPFISAVPPIEQDVIARARTIARAGHVVRLLSARADRAQITSPSARARRPAHARMSFLQHENV